MRVVHYVRVSTDEQGKSGYSVREQLHTLNAHSTACGDTVDEEIADEGYSGASPDRPGLIRVMELAESGDVDVVRAVKRDRLFRSRLYRLLTERDLEEFGVKLEALNDTGHRELERGGTDAWNLPPMGSCPAGNSRRSSRPWTRRSAPRE